MSKFAKIHPRRHLPKLGGSRLNALDINKDGKVDYSEANRLYQGQGLTQAQLLAMDGAACNQLCDKLAGVRDPSLRGITFRASCTACLVSADGPVTGRSADMVPASPHATADAVRLHGGPDEFFVLPR